MGNCLRRDSAMVWASGDDDDDWVSVSSQLHESKTTASQTDDVSNKAYNPEKQRLLGEIRSSSGSCSSTSSTTGGDRLKIKITKKELEDLEQGGNVHGLSSVEQLLARLMMMNGRDDHDQYYDDHDEMDPQRHWRPVLQSIPEVDYVD